MKNSVASLALLGFIGAPVSLSAADHSTPFVDGADLPIIASTIEVEKAPPTKAEVETPVSLPVVKAVNNLRAGTILHRSDLNIENDNGFILDDFVGKEIKRAVYAGKTITKNDVGPPTIIERNAIVSLEFVRGPLVITTEGRALDSGAMGDGVRVMNLSSKIILSAVVTGPNQARTR